MSTIMSFITLLGLLALLNRSMAWGRRALARHRALWESLGYTENNPDHRLRADSYKRVGFIAWIAFGVAFCIIGNAMRFSGIAVVFCVACLSAFPAVIFWGVYRTVKEWTHPYGEMSLSLRDNQFHREGRALVPDGQKGTAQVETPAKVGILNPLGWVVTRPQPIVEKVSR